MLPNNPIESLVPTETWLAPSCQVAVTRLSEGRWRVMVTVPGVQFNRGCKTLEATRKTLRLAYQVVQRKMKPKTAVELAVAALQKKRQALRAKEEWARRKKRGHIKKLPPVLKDRDIVPGEVYWTRVAREGKAAWVQCTAVLWTETIVNNKARYIAVRLDGTSLPKPRVAAAFWRKKPV